MEWTGLWTLGFRHSCTAVVKPKGLVIVAVISDEYWLIGRQIAPLRLDYSSHISCAAAGKLWCQVRNWHSSIACTLTCLAQHRHLPVFSKLLGIIYRCKNTLLQKLCCSPLGMNMFSPDNVI